jgi:hypothetical protein
MSEPASAFNALSGFGWMSKQHIVTSTSLSVSFESQSRFSVSTHTPPVCGSTFGWKIGVLKFAVGGV